MIEDYGANPRSQTATIQTNTQTVTPALYSTGWWLQWVEVTGSGSRGISLSDHMTVLESRIVDNARLGIGGGGNGVTIADSQIADNGLTVARRGWEAGGIKTIADNVLIEGNTITGNGAPGVWTDGGATNIVITKNTFSGNRYGVHVEISHGVHVSSNTITGSTQQAVLVIASSLVTISDNHLSANFGGVIVGGVGRIGPDGIHLNAVSVLGNDITDSGTTGLHQSLPAGAVVSFDGNHYVGEHLQWNGHGITYAALRALGQEAKGSWVK